MKKLFCILTISLSLQLNGFAQITDTATVPTASENYLTKSKSQKTSAWALLIGGAVFLTSGSVIAANNLSWGSNDQGSEYGLGMGMFFIGGASMLSSIPLFIASARNKGRAMSASAQLKLENYQAISRRGFSSPNYPALSLRLTIK